MKVKELIKELSKYDGNTLVNAGYISKNNCMCHFELLMEESNRIGDRDAEEELMLWIGFKETDYT